MLVMVFVLSAFLDNIAAALIGGVMIWFDSSAGVARSSMYPEAKSVGLWLKRGWHLVLAYVVGLSVLLDVFGWHPDAPIKKAAFGSPLLALSMSPPPAGVPGRLRRQAG